MTKPMNSAEAEILTAVDTLMGQLETEQSWIEDLRTTLDQSEKRAQRLLTSVEAALHMLSIPLKRQIHFRLRRMRNDAFKRGRPVRDGRQREMLKYIANKAEGTVTTAEIRLHLESQNLRATPQYVSNQLAAWIKEGLLSRAAHGLYQINEKNASLRALRFQKDRQAVVEAIRADLHSMKAGLQDRAGSVSRFNSP